MGPLKKSNNNKLQSLIRRRGCLLLLIIIIFFFSDLRLEFRQSQKQEWIYMMIRICPCMWIRVVGWGPKFFSFGDSPLLCRRYNMQMGQKMFQCESCITNARVQYWLLYNRRTNHSHAVLILHNPFILLPFAKIHGKTFRKRIYNTGTHTWILL